MTVSQMRLVTLSTALGLFLLGGAAVAQVAPGNVAPGNFDDLARRASAALDVHPAEAVALYQKALDIRPDWADGWLYMGASLYELRRFTEARIAFRKGITLVPQKGTPWAFLGLTEYELGNYKDALTFILKGESIGLADKPAFVITVHYHAALIYLRSSDFARALDQLRPLAKTGNETLEVIEAFGLSALAMNTLPARLPAAKRPLVRLAGRAAAAFVAERAEQSRSLFEELAARFPNDAGVHYMYGVFLTPNDPAAAEEEFRKELRISPRHVLARVQLALLLIKRGETKESVTLAQEAVRLEPGSAVCQATLGRALLEGDQITQAVAALETAVKLAPDAAKAHFYLAQAYSRAGRRADAAKERAAFDRLRAEQEPVLVPSP
jgi:tetratricopeptide (TPR) repeat protein